MLFIQWNSQECNTLFCQDSITKGINYVSQSKLYTQGDCCQLWVSQKMLTLCHWVCTIFLLLNSFIKALVQNYLPDMHAKQSIISYKQRHQFQRKTTSLSLQAKSESQTINVKGYCPQFSKSKGSQKNRNNEFLLFHS